MEEALKFSPRCRSQHLWVTWAKPAVCRRLSMVQRAARGRGWTPPGPWAGWPGGMEAEVHSPGELRGTKGADGKHHPHETLPTPRGKDRTENPAVSPSPAVWTGPPGSALSFPYSFLTKWVKCVAHHPSPTGLLIFYLSL